MSDTSNEISYKIDQLDKLLIKGFHLYRIVLNEHQESKSNKDFQVNDFIAKKRAIFDQWNEDVANILVSLNRQHYYFHFIHPKKPAGIIKVGMHELLSNIVIHQEFQLYALEDIIIKLHDDETLAIRKEIAEKEYQADILYKVTYSDHSREIKVNGMVLHKPDFASENDKCFDFIYKNSGREISIDELEQMNGEKITKRLVDVVRGLGFKGNYQKVFFPVVTATEIKFVNPITKRYAMIHDLPELKLK